MGGKLRRENRDCQKKTSPDTTILRTERERGVGKMKRRNNEEKEGQTDGKYLQLPG